ncbi:hypothetical protein M5689_003549 [Euphorbia peplus]|nr:hypothetical protein M5689_003549 [Euphorbia peplus]
MTKVPSNQIVSESEVASSAIPSTNQSQDTKKNGSKRRKTSDVWDHFVELVDDKAACMYCTNILSCGPTYGTSHMKSYLLRCDKKKNKDVKQFLVPSDVTQGGKHCLRTYNFGNIDLRKSIGLFLLDAGYAFRAVERKYFRFMMSRSNPQF